MTTFKCGRTTVAAAFVAALLLPLSSIAQEEEESAGPGFIQVRIVTTTAAGTSKWVELQKEAAEAVEEGAPGRDVWQVVRGELDTFHIVSTLENFAALDEQGGGGPDAEWVAAITPTVDTRSQTIMRMHGDLTLPNPEGYEPSLLMLRYFTIRQGQSDVFHTWLREELQPALAAGGATGVYFGHVAHGGNVATCVIAGHAANWAEFDGPGGFDHMSEEEIDALFADWGSMVARHEVRTLQYRADLSY